MASSRAKRIAMSAAALLMVAGPVSPQTCDSLQGNTSCNIGKGQALPPDRESDWNFSFAGSRGFGTDLLTGRSDDDAGMFGAVVFGGSGATCLGPFRSRKC